MIVDQYMCSDTCPCYDGFVDESHYLSTEEDVLNEYGRTNSDKVNYIPLKFVSDVPTPENLSFDSFYSCYTYWENKAKEDESVDMKKKFKIKPNPDVTNVEQIRPNLYGDVTKYNLEPLEMKNYAVSLNPFEESFGCAGFCTPALFYFSQSIEKGRPPNACLESVTQYASSAGDPFLVMSGLLSTVAFFCWLFHFSIYGRDLTPIVNETDKTGYDQGDTETPNKNGNDNPIEMQNIEVDV